MNNTDIQLIINKLDIVEVISNYLPLKKQGKSFVGLCPFHSDGNPSMHVSKEKQIFKCFSCGEGGNAITFIQKYNNISFPEALKIAASKAGVEIKSYQNRIEVPEEISKQFRMNKEIVEYSNYLLHQNELAKKYLNERDFSVAAADKFGLGIFNDSNSVKAFLLAKGFTESELINSGVINENGKSKYENRLLIPIKDIESNIVGFTARQIVNDSKYPKYINSNDSLIFKKGNILYNMDLAFKAAKLTKFIILVEGNIDAQQLSVRGYENTVATMGTALTDEQIKALKRLNVPVVLCFDGDPAGISAAEKNYFLLRHAGIESEVVLLPDQLDPDDCIRERPEEFRRLLNSHPHFLDFKLNTYVDTGNFNDAQKFIINFMKTLVDQKNPIAEDFFLKKLSDVTNIDLLKIESQYDIINSANSKEKFNIRINQDSKLKQKEIVNSTKTFINFKNKPKLEYKKEMTEKFDSKVFSVVAFDSDKVLDRKDILLKYTEHKGPVLETTITLVNYEGVEFHANNIANILIQQLASHLEIDKNNLNYVGFIHSDIKDPHLHIQVWQKEPFLSEYKLRNSIIDKLEKAVNEEMAIDYPKEKIEEVMVNDKLMTSSI